MVEDSALRSKLLAAQEANYQELRICRGLRPGLQFDRQPLTTWRNSRAKAPTGINVAGLREVDRSQENAPPLSEGDPEDLALTEKAEEGT